MKIDLHQLKHNDIPDEYCVIRFSDTNRYLHCQDGYFFFKERFHGCFVVYCEIAQQILDEINIMWINKSELQIVDFKDAYKMHGLVEAQMCYN